MSVKFRTLRLLSKAKVENPTYLAQQIQSFGRTNQLNLGKQLHSHLISSGYPLCTFLTNHLLNMYSKCGLLNYSVKLFDKMTQPNIVSWTAMITAFSQNLLFLEAIETFLQMKIIGESPTQFAFSSVIRACESLGSVVFCRQLHCLALKCGFGCELFVGSNLADTYSKSGMIVDACKVFEEMECKDEVAWTAMIDGYAKNGDFEEALLAFKKLVNDRVLVDQHVLCCILDACRGIKGYNFGKSLHSLVIKVGFESELSVGNALTDMYSKSGDMSSASNVFELISKYKDIVSFTSLIDGFVKMEQIDEAFKLFVELQNQRIEPNEFTYSSLLKGCANQAALEQGTQFHAQVLKLNFESNPFVSSVLVDMYGKSGLIDDSIRVFNSIENPTAFAWNSRLSVFAQHGLANNAIETFDAMNKKGVNPNEVTFVSLLIGCSHAGLVEEGLDYFYSMEKTYGITPKAEHYNCVLDLLGRSGKLKRAEEVIKEMPFEPDVLGWSSFLGACKVHGDKVRGKFAAEKLLQLEPENSGAHILLSDIHAKEREWEDVSILRKKMRDQNLKKVPGFSWVHVGNKTHVFGSEDWSHPRKKEIYLKLDLIVNQIKRAGYVPKIESVYSDVDDKTKESMLLHHSEKIAVAFALMSMPMGKPIIVKKNLRVCVDCHSAMKYISKVTRRLIIIRDNSRFHHFVNGSCSCGDFW